MAENVSKLNQAPYAIEELLYNMNIEMDFNQASKENILEIAKNSDEIQEIRKTQWVLKKDYKFHN
jgi:hypothetical protein